MALSGTPQMWRRVSIARCRPHFSRYMRFMRFMCHIRYMRYIRYIRHMRYIRYPRIEHALSGPLLAM